MRELYSEREYTAASALDFKPEGPSCVSEFCLCNPEKQLGSNAAGTVLICHGQRLAAG